MTKLYHDIVFINEYDDETIKDFLNDNTRNLKESDVVEYLAQWDYGSEMEHSPRNEPPYGTSDTVFKYGEYILSYNSGLGYAGLTRIEERQE